jgi:hypothetical protein
LIPVTKANVKDRRVILKRLRNLEVYTADQVIQEWTVKFNGVEIRGRPKPGHVVLTAAEDVLKIYLAKDYFENEHNPEEFVEELFCFCGMDRKSSAPKDSKYCLQVVLTERTTARIKAILESNGAPSFESLRLETLDIDSDPESDDEKAKSKPRAAPSGIFSDGADRGTSRFGRFSFILGTTDNFGAIFGDSMEGEFGHGIGLGFSIQDDDTASGSRNNLGTGMGSQRGFTVFSMGSFRAERIRRTREQSIRMKGEKFVSSTSLEHYTNDVLTYFRSPTLLKSGWERYTIQRTIGRANSATKPSLD